MNDNIQPSMHQAELDERYKRQKTLLEENKSFLGSKTSWMNQYNDWKYDAENKCNSGNKSKKENCKNERMKTANERKAIADDYQRKIDQNNAELKTIADRITELTGLIQKEANTAEFVSKALSEKHGKSYQQTLIEGQGQAQAHIITAQKTSEAQADAIREESQANTIITLKKGEADASNKRKMGFILAGAGLLTMSILAFILIKKLKKNKTK